jgi:prophage regulatory protein
MAIQIYLAPTILRIKQVQARTGLSRSTIYFHISNGSFPKPIRLVNRAVGWIETEIDQWLNKQIENSRGNDNENDENGS